MQRQGILNSHIAKVLADLGHTDTILYLRLWFAST